MKTMKKIFLFTLLAIITLVAVCFGADPVAPVAAAPVVVPPAVNTFTSILSWLTANQGVAGMLVVAIIDFILAINPQWKSNGALHFIYTVAQKKATPPV